MNAEKNKELFDQINEIIDKFEDAIDEPDADLQETKIERCLDVLRVWNCQTFREHNYNLDHCGLWQHQYCSSCGEPKYSALNEKSCNELFKEMGDITEEQYLKNRGNA